MSRKRRIRLARTIVTAALLTFLGVRGAMAFADSQSPTAGRATTPISTAPLVSADGSGGSASSRPKTSTPAPTTPSSSTSSAPSATVTPRPPVTYADASWLPPAQGKGLLAPGSDPSVLPGPILIADKLNNRVIIVDPRGHLRWQFPRPGDLRPGETFTIPDDAFFSPDGREIIATQEDDFVVTIIDIATHRIVYRYGHPGTPGGNANYLDNPDDAMLLPDGSIVIADIKNCRIVVIAKGRHVTQHVLGQNGCVHNPPSQWASPNGAFPLHNGNWLVTEINGDWVSELTPSGKVLWSTHPQGVSYPSDTNEVSPNTYLTVDYHTPGQVLMFNSAGKTLWRFAPTGSQALDHPSLALPLPNGMVLVNDDRNHRVIVIDPKTNKIVWQYGHTGVSGSRAGYLDNPDGVDLVAPYGLLRTHASTLVAP